MNDEKTYCPICHSSDIQPSHPETNPAYCYCRACKTAFQLSIADTSESPPAVSYNEEYFRPWEAGPHGLELTRTSKSLSFDSWLNEFEQFQRPGKLLDIGCAMGFFLDRAKIRGWNGFGVEISSYASQIAQRNHGTQVLCGTLAQSSFPKEFFQAITLLDVLEHLPDPVQTIKTLSALLCNGGHIMISTPNLLSLSSNLLGTRWFQRKPEHTMLFSPRSLQYLLKKCGLKLLLLRPA